MSALLDDVDCLEMPDGTWAVTDGSQFWLHQPAPLQASLFSPSLGHPGSSGHTRQLLAAALAAGAARHPRDTGSPSEQPSLPRYIYALAGSYQTTHRTPLTMRHVAVRLRGRGDETLARYCEEVAGEESGHERLLLQDLEALGLRADEFVRDVRPRRAMELLALIEEFADGPVPVAVLGCAYALERHALLITPRSGRCRGGHRPSGIGGDARTAPAQRHRFGCRACGEIHRCHCRFGSAGPDRRRARRLRNVCLDLVAVRLPRRCRRRSAHRTVCPPVKNARRLLKVKESASW